MSVPAYICPRYDNACPSMASCTLHGCKRGRRQQLQYDADVESPAPEAPIKTPKSRSAGRDAA